MPTLNKMFLEQSHLAMPPSVWLHVNGVSLTTDIHHYQAPVHTYDYQTKHLQSPVQSPTPPLVPTPTIVPCSVTTIDGPFNHNNTNKQYQKLENLDLPKKLFIDRHIKKAKSLPGLIKGTALSRHTPLHSSTFTSPAPPNQVINKISDDQLSLVTTTGQEENHFVLPEPIEQHNEIRRPRVYFADFNKIQFFDDNNEISQQQHAANATKLRRHRQRTSKKLSSTNGMNSISPSIQHTQILHNSTLPLSHHQIGQESNNRKQQSLITQRSHSMRSAAHFPDILNQTLPNEHSSNEISHGKYTLQREKPLVYFPKPANDVPVNSSMEMSSDHTRHGHNQISPRQDSHNRTYDSEALENSNIILNLTSSSINSTSTNRQRSLLQTISLRQQFHSPIKLKATGISSTINNNNNNSQQQQQQQTNNSKLSTHRSSSLKYTNPQTPDEHDDIHLNKSLLVSETRPMTASASARQIKRAEVIHFNSKTPFAINGNIEYNKQHHSETTKQRFQNILTVVRPPYASNSGNTSYVSPNVTHNDYSKQTFNPNQTKGKLHNSRSTSARGPVGLHVTQNTIFV
ncbi:unnamed protein product [Rotaria magnacalcarata]|uniref:Uncharacterized protein n=4 Tax=Rotaria magnacalcarata TaxID=392030 RepID=A0A814RNG4_9BILA|nr:unnamed protein product [Rotaria magnacalcarata]CAF1684039.1 unnamed protein product [Rotaria magnacalcarata]CAF1991239.1 unnamed protein product [Rotaria magnacalcarata]CAF4078089.1 unnamed protein product [Rotaria magnacalcarata]CAF4113650.1 unnamed protein product [Rotaria magnacalcarata]